MGGFCKGFLFALRSSKVVLYPQHLPKISCLLVTAGGRFETFKRSYQCYVDQTYQNRELVVVNDGPSEYQAEMSEWTKDRKDVRYVYLRGKYTLGALRNIAVSLCYGDLWVQWDDDDYNMPERLAVQAAYLLSHPEAKACFLTDQLHYYYATSQLYWNNWWRQHSGMQKRFGLIPGTILARRGLAFKYPSAGANCRLGEDSVLSGNLCRVNDDVLLLEDRGHLHIYSFHGKNVWDVEHHLNISRVRGLPKNWMIEHRDQICRTLNYMNLSDTISVMGRDGLAFTYRSKNAA